MTEAGSAAPPSIAKRSVSTNVHGVDLVDEYSWLKADNWQEVLRDPTLLPADIRQVIEAENAYAKATLRDTEALQKTLAAEMRARIKEDDSEVPRADGDHLYYSRHRGGGQHPLFCRRPRAGGDETLLLDGDREGEGKTFFRIGRASHAPDHTRLAWSVDDKGSEYFAIRVRDLVTGEDGPPIVPDSDGSLVWLADSSGFYYVRLDANHRPAQVLRHRLDSEAGSDELVFEETDPRWFIHIGRTQSRRFAVFSVSDHDSGECHLLDLADNAARPRLVEARRPGIRYDLDHSGDTLFIRTNDDGAEDFKIVGAPTGTPGKAAWRDIVPSRPGCMITDHLALAGHLIRLEREAGLPRLVIRSLADGREQPIDFAEEAYSLGLDNTGEFATTTLRFNYSSMTTPRETYDYDIATRERVLRKRQEIPSGHDPSAYVTRRLFATAPDGEAVPVSLLYRADLPLDGSAPLLLYGYGAYGHAMPAAFSANRLSLVDRGFVYAIAHIRGGTDKGWRWYTDGKLAKKPNTFTDFLAAARHLIEARYTAAGRIVAQGGSAGGMLMGACANMAPDLFAGIVADVPFVDVLNTMLDADLPLTPPEWLEWGNPAADADAFATIKSYSPYDNVAAQPYPPILAIGGLTDPRVTYWEPAKWVARLRERMTGGGPILLKTNMGAGHGGASGRFDRLDDIALDYAFALRCAGSAAA